MVDQGLRCAERKIIDFRVRPTLPPRNPVGFMIYMGLESDYEQPADQFNIWRSLAGSHRHLHTTNFCAKPGRSTHQINRCLPDFNVGQVESFEACGERKFGSWISRKGFSQMRIRSIEVDKRCLELINNSWSNYCGLWLFDKIPLCSKEGANVMNVLPERDFYA